MCRGQGLTHFKQITSQYTSLQSARHAQAETINYITQNTLIISLQTNFMFFRLVFTHVQISCQSNTHYSTPIIGADQQAKVKFFFILRAGYYLCDANTWDVRLLQIPESPSINFLQGAFYFAFYQNVQFCLRCFWLDVKLQNIWISIFSKAFYSEQWNT